MRPTVFAACAAAGLFALTSGGRAAPSIEWSADVYPQVGSPCGYVAIRGDDVPAAGRIRFVESSPGAGHTPKSIPQRVVRGHSKPGGLVVALRGLERAVRYDIVLDRPGRKPLVAHGAYLADVPSLPGVGSMPSPADGRAGPGEAGRIEIEAPGRDFRVTVGGKRARLLQGPWALGRGNVTNYPVTFEIPNLPPGPAKVVVADRCGLAGEVATIDVLPAARSIHAEVGGRKFRTRLQRAVHSSGRLQIDGQVPGRAKDAVWLASEVVFDVAGATLPATLTSATSVGFVSVGVPEKGRDLRSREGGTWEYVIERISDGEIEGTFKFDLPGEDATPAGHDPTPAHRLVFRRGRFRLPLQIR